MDLKTGAAALKATLSAQHRQQAEEQLSQFSKTDGFVSSLIQIILNEQIELDVRLAGAIYLKNHVNTFWTDYNDPSLSGDANNLIISNALRPPNEETKKLFVVSNVDKEYLRTVMIDAILRTKDPLRCQLITTASTMIRNDFPRKWSQFINQIHNCLSTDNVTTWHSVLLVFYTLVQHYEYKRIEDRGPIDEVMTILLPLLYQRFFQLFSQDESDQTALILKQIFKIFHAYFQFHLNLRVLSTQTMSNWLNLCCAMLERRLPQRLESIDEEDRPSNPWWKCKKWSLHILNRTFERHGAPSNLSKEEPQEKIDFANFYLKEFSPKVIGLIFSTLEAYRQKVYVSPRVLQLSLNYLRESVRHSSSWKIMQNNVVILIQDIIYPVLCINEDEIELFKDEPIEFVRNHLDTFEEFVSPVSAAENFLSDSVGKRKDFLMKTVSFIGTKLNTAGLNSREKDGVLHMLGVIGNVLIKKKDFANQLENLLVNCLFAEIQSSIDFLRARACYVLRNLAKLKYANRENFLRCLSHLIHCLCNEKSLPVQVEAAMALSTFLSDSPIGQDGRSIIVANLQMIVMKIIEIIQQTEIDEVMTVLQKVVNSYDQELQPIAVQITGQLVQFFRHVVCSENTTNNEKKTEERTIAAMAVLSTLDTIVSCMMGKKEILDQIERITYDIILLVLRDGIIDFYEEIFTLIETLTMRTVSPFMWQVFYLIKEAFFRDASDYFSEIMHCLHNYIVNDTPAFLSQSDRLETIFEMCQHVILNDLGEDMEAHAAKLIEVIVLQCQDHVVRALPAIFQLFAQRFQREIGTSELRLMLLQVFVVILWLNPDRFFETLNNVAINDPSTQTILANFFTQWMNDCESFVGVHDRRICALGLCTLLRINSKYYSAISSVVPKILPNCILIYEGLMKTYQRQNDRNQKETNDDDDSPNSDNENGEEKFEKSKTKSSRDDEMLNDDGSEIDEEEDETDLESFSTVLESQEDIDEFDIFFVSLRQLQSDTSGYYQALVQNLTSDQKIQIQNIIDYSQKRKQQKIGEKQ